MKPIYLGDIEVWLGASELTVDERFQWNNNATYCEFTDLGPRVPNVRYYEHCLATHLYLNFFVCEKNYSIIYICDTDMIETNTLSLTYLTRAVYGDKFMFML